MKVKSQITINASKKSVWDTIINIKKSAEFIKSIENIEIVNEPTNGVKDLRWKETRIYFGKPATIEKWITESNENVFYKTKAESDGFIFETNNIIEDSNNSVILTSTHETKATGLITKLKSIPMIFFKGFLRKAIHADLVDIKNEVENN